MSATLDEGGTLARRTFIERAASGAFALATVPLLTSCSPADGAPAAIVNAATPPDGEPWLSPLTGKHKQVFDAPETNGGFPLIFAYAYKGTMTEAYKLQPSDVSAFIVTRHFGIPIVLTDPIWAKYQLGKFFNVTDPKTKAPSTRNIYYKSQPGDILNIDASADKLLAMGVVIGACNVALTILSGMAATAAGLKDVTPEAAVAEWKAGMIPGTHVLPSGVMAVGRSQEHGCTYCFAG